MASFDLRSASLHLSQFIETRQASSSNQNTKTLIRFWDPTVIIVPPNKMAADTMVWGYQNLWTDVIATLVRKDRGGKGCGSQQPLTNCTFNGSLDHVNIDATRLLIHSAMLFWAQATKKEFVPDVQDDKNSWRDELMSNNNYSLGFHGFFVNFQKRLAKKVTDAVLGFDNSRRSQNMISSIILLKVLKDCALRALSSVIDPLHNALATAQRPQIKGAVIKTLLNA